MSLTFMIQAVEQGARTGAVSFRRDCMKSQAADSKGCNMPYFSTFKRLVAGMLLVFLALPTSAEHQTSLKELSSFDGRYTIKILQSPLSGSDPVDGFFTLVICDGQHVLSRYPTEGYLLSAFWSPDGKNVAVNNRRANSGDYLWVFSLKDGKALKAPDEIPGEVLADRASRKFSGISVRNFKKYFNLAKGWTDRGELEVQSQLVFVGSKDGVVLRKASYRVTHNELVEIHEDFEVIQSSGIK